MANKLYEESDIQDTADAIREMNGSSDKYTTAQYGRMIRAITSSGANVFDLVYPVGSIYMSAVEVDPSLLFGGVWEQIKDRFLLAVGDTYEVGSTGGEATHKLTVDEMPSHTHIPFNYSSGVPSDSKDSTKWAMPVGLKNGGGLRALHRCRLFKRNRWFR